MGEFIEETIGSVLSQEYPHIEYLVIDGGSTDGTLDILRKYKGRLHFISKRDSGPAEAINRGFQMSTGTIFAWLNADDTYLPGTVRAVVERFADHIAVDAVYGDAYWTDTGGHIIAPYPTRDVGTGSLQCECSICQPACFMRREMFERLAMLNTKLQYSFDYDLWIRASGTCRLERLPRFLATSRMHRGNRTLGQRQRIFHESIQVLKQHYGYVPFSWIHSYCTYLIDGRDQFYQPLRPTFLNYILSLPVGCWYNARSIGRYYREWSSIMTYDAFMRRCKAHWSATGKMGGRGPSPQ